MLILKGNLTKDTLRAASLGPALAAALAAVLAALAVPAGLVCNAAPAWGAPAAMPARAAIRAPETVAAEFYGWYLETLDADQDPLSDRYERLSA